MKNIKNIERKRIVCDMMVWYNIGSGEIQIPDKNKFQLVATFNNFQEINHTKKVFTDYKLLKGACNAIIKYAEVIIDEPPIVYIHNIANPQNAIKQESVYYSAVKEFAKRNNIKPTIESSKKFNDLLNDYRKNIINNFVNYTTAEINNSRKLIHANSKNKKDFNELIKKNTIEEESITNLKEQIINNIKYHFPDFEILNKEFWEDIKLYMLCRRKYFRLLKIDRERKVNFNDLVDLFNLVYVNKKSLYWTEDGSWKEIILQAGFADYLYKS